MFINAFMTDWSIFLTNESDTCSSLELSCSAYLLSSTKGRPILNFFSFNGKESDFHWLHWRGKGPNFVGAIFALSHSSSLISMISFHDMLTVACSDHTELVYIN